MANVRTHTYAILDVSAETFREIQMKLLAAGYQHTFQEDAAGELVIDLHGVAIRDEDADTDVDCNHLSVIDPSFTPRRRES